MGVEGVEGMKKSYLYLFGMILVIALIFASNPNLLQSFTGSITGEKPILVPRIGYAWCEEGTQTTSSALKSIGSASTTSIGQTFFLDSKVYARSELFPNSPGAVWNKKSYKCNAKSCFISNINRNNFDCINNLTYPQWFVKVNGNTIEESYAEYTWENVVDGSPSNIEIGDGDLVHVF